MERSLDELLILISRLKLGQDLFSAYSVSSTDREVIVLIQCYRDVSITTSSISLSDNHVFPV